MVPNSSVGAALSRGPTRNLPRGLAQEARRAQEHLPRSGNVHLPVESMYGCDSSTSTFTSHDGLLLQPALCMLLTWLKSCPSNVERCCRQTLCR